MASAQCYKTCVQNCQQSGHYHQQQHGSSHYQQQQQHGSIGHKVADLYKGHHNDGTKTEYYSQAEVIYEPGQVAKYQSNTCNRTRHNHAAAGTVVEGATATRSQGKNRRERRSMFQKIKDGISGHSSDSGSSSDECDSDNENRRHRKYCN